MHYCVIGASVAMMLEASHLLKLGHSVTVLSSSSKVGGAWESTEMYGISGVDNAVHYLVPNKAGIDAMSRVGIKIVLTTNEKFQLTRIFRRPVFTLYDSKVGGIIRALLRRSVSDIFKVVSRKSQMIHEGCKGLQVWLEDFVVRHGITIEYQKQVEAVYVEANNVLVTLTDGERLVFDGIKMGYGVYIPKISIPTGETFCSKEFISPRPAGHFSIEGLKTDSKLEIIYLNDVLMKYMNLSGYEEKGIVVCAFKNNKNIEIMENHIDTLLIELCHIGLRIRRTSDITISNVVIPQWPLGVADYIHRHSLGLIEILCTEDLTKSFELYEERWSLPC